MPRGPRPGGGREPRLAVHDRAPGAPPRGEGEERRDVCSCTARPAGGGHRAPRARSASRASPLRDRLSSQPRRAVEQLGAVAIDYRNEDFVALVRELPGKGVDVALDGLGGALSLRSFRVLRPGGRLVVFGHYSTLAQGRKSRRGWIEVERGDCDRCASGLLSPRRRVLAYRIQKLRERPRPRGTGGGPRYPEWFREDFARAARAASSWRRSTRSWPSACRSSEARRAHELLERSAATGENSCSCHEATRTLADGARRPGGRPLESLRSRQLPTPRSSGAQQKDTVPGREILQKNVDA